LSTSLGNGFFEEVLWRGVYMELFPDSILLRIVWPTIWFALWHYAPGSVAPDGNVLGLIIGSGVMGFYLAFLAKRTGTIWWTIVAHTIGGMIMIA
jgi:membrane protease YdiL (CAAX protease family)